MAKFLSLKTISKTRKVHRCIACGDLIEQGSKAWEWTSVDSGIHTAYLHHICGEDTSSICFSCKRCDDGDGFPENFMIEAMRNDEDCQPCKRLRDIQ